MWNIATRSALSTLTAHTGRISALVLVGDKVGRYSRSSHCGSSVTASLRLRQRTHCSTKCAKGRVMDLVALAPNRPNQQRSHSDSALRAEASSRHGSMALTILRSAGILTRQTHRYTRALQTGRCACGTGGRASACASCARGTRRTSAGSRRCARSGAATSCGHSLEIRPCGAP